MPTLGTTTEQPHAVSADTAAYLQNVSTGPIVASDSISPYYETCSVEISRARRHASPRFRHGVGLQHAAKVDLGMTGPAEPSSFASSYSNVSHAPSSRGRCAVPRLRAIPGVELARTNISVVSRHGVCLWNVALNQPA